MPSPLYPRSRIAAARMAGFTLIEILMVVGILGLVLAMGLPAFIQAIRKDPLRQAMSDIEDACSKARQTAILRGTPVELVLRESGELSVAEAPETQAPSNELSDEPSDQPASRADSHVFARHVPVEMVGLVLFVNKKEETSEARVHFYPNGTSDEFRVILTDVHGGIRTISLECVTALATVEVVR